jgi:uncharacterized protein
MAIHISLDPERIAAFCRRHHIRSLALFGDVDVLVQFEDGHTPGWEFFDLEDELSSIVGHHVDLNTTGFLSRSLRQDVLDEALILYGT